MRLFRVVCACAIAVPSATSPLFDEVAAKSGLAFTHFNGATGDYFLPEIMGPGVALFDYDGDGDLDVYLLQGTRLTANKPLLHSSAARIPPGNRLFRNDIKPGAPNTLRFTDVTREAGVGFEGYGMGAAVGDYDNDGDLDLYLTNFGRNVLYRNNGDGMFTDVTGAAGVDDERWSTSASFLDYDRDGDLDLFVTNYIDYTIANNKLCREPGGQRDYCGPAQYRPVPDRLFRNEGNGRFVDATEPAGLTKAFGPGLGVVAADFDGDAWIDIYVANDGAPNQLWINQRNGTFEENGLLSGAALSGDGLPEGSMGIAAADFDNDGDEDLFVTNLPKETNTLYVNGGKGNFDDATHQAGLAVPSIPFTGFGTDWFDYDHDGWLDLFVANGAVLLVEALRGQSFPYQQRNQLFRNVGGGRYAEVRDAGPALALSEVSRSAAFGDVDNDGDIDIVVTNNNGPVRLLLNQAAKGHWLQVQLEQPRANRWAFGARVGVERQGQPTLWRRVRTDGSYLAANDPRVHFGLGASKAIDALRVEWPDGVQERWTGVETDRLVVLKRGTGQQ
jgi:hypothetical protein